MEQQNDYKNYISTLLKRNSKKKFKISNSYGSKQAWRWIKKNKWLDIGQPIAEGVFGKIIKEINIAFVNRLLCGHDVLFPHNMGRLEIRKYPVTKKIENGKIKTNLPIDWKKTINLWYQDDEAKANKTLIRHDLEELYKIHYNRRFANYENKTFYEFVPSRSLKIKVKNKLNNKELDALLL